MEDTPEEHFPSADPAQAFEDLRAEVSVMRRAVEALPSAWEENRPPDYSPDLGRIAKGLAVVAVQLDAINKHPALTMTQEQHRQAIAQAGNGLMREAAQKLDRATQDTERERQQLAGLIGTARRQDEQRTWLIYAAPAILTGCGKSSKLEGFPSLLAGLARNWSRFLRVPPALTAKIVPSGPFWTDSGPRYAAAPSSFGIRTRL